MGAEAVVVLDPDAVRRMDFVRKLSMQLGSKMRFLSAQLVSLYDGDLWLRSGSAPTRWPAGSGTPSTGSPGCG